MFRQLPVLDQCLADAGVPVAHYLVIDVDLAGIPGLARDDVYLADVVQQPGEQRLVRPQHPALPGHGVRQRGHAQPLLPESFQVRADMRQFGRVAHLRRCIGQRRCADAVVTNAGDGHLQIGDRRAAAVKQG